jgi:hypothetical protein
MCSRPPHRQIDASVTACPRICFPISFSQSAFGYIRSRTWPVRRAAENVFASLAGRSADLWGGVPGLEERKGVLNTNDRNVQTVAYAHQVFRRE